MKITTQEHAIDQKWFEKDPKNYIKGWEVLGITTNPPIHQSTNPPIHQSTNPPIHNPPIHQSTPIYDVVNYWLDDLLFMNAIKSAGYTADDDDILEALKPGVVKLCEHDRNELVVE